MSIQFRHIEPHYLLKNYIDKMWLFESSGRMPIEDMKLVVPNGNIKLTISYQNGIIATINEKPFASKEHDITVTGLIDVPVSLDVDADVATQTIGIEFNPKGAYRFFQFPLKDIQNQICSLSDLLGNTAKILIEQMYSARSPLQKVELIQNFLLKQFSFNNEDLIFNFCIEKIMATAGKITIKDLEKMTGYSSRWLNVKFNEKIGISPKNLSSIIRFKHYYQSLISGKNKSFFKNDFCDLYYDQSHFIKDFKRFTGLAPTRFEKQTNDFGEKYYSG